MSDYLMGKIERGGTSVPVGDGHAPSGGAGPVERTFMVRPALPCTSCDHALICSIRPRLETAAREFRPPISPDPAVTISVEATVTCSYYRATGKAPRSASEPRGTMGSSPEASAGFRRAVSEADRIRTSAQRGADASVAARAARPAGSRGRAPSRPIPPLETIYAVIRANPGLSGVRVARILEIPDPTLHNILRRLHDRSKLPDDIVAWRAMRAATIRRKAQA